MTPSRPLSRHEFQVAILCALPLEYNAVSAIFDHFWDEKGDSYGRAPGDLNSYTTGCIGRHNVVLALMAHMGKANAASAGASLRSSYSGLKLVLLVGICGAMPYNQFGAEILLGDTIISKAIVQHDFGRKYPDSFVMKNAAEDRLQMPNKLVRNLLATLETDRGLELIETRSAYFMKELQTKANAAPRSVTYSYPGAAEDKLYDSTHRHKHRSSPNCVCWACHEDSDPVCSDAMNASCAEIGCDSSYLVARSRLNAQHAMSHNAAHRPRIHIGRVASGDTVMKSASDRDMISRLTRAIAFEMEGAGIWDEFNCIIIIKGVCDYADSHKSKVWQPFAAAAAAATSKAVLERYIQTDVSAKAKMGAPTNSMLALPDQCRFVGREADLESLEEIACLPLDNFFSRSVIAIWGFSGVGKSQLVSEFVRRQLGKHRNRAIFWISGASEHAFEQSIISVLQGAYGELCLGPNDPVDALEHRNALVRRFFSELSSSAPTGTLLVIDGLSNSASLQTRLHGFLRGLTKCCVILTTTRRDVAYRYPLRLEIRGLSEDDAVKFILARIPSGVKVSDIDARKLATLLNGHPLSLEVATSLISQHPQSIAQYTKKWENRVRGDDSLSTHDALQRAFELSFDELERANPTSAHLLMLFSFLDHRDLWYEICFDAADETSPEWLQQLSSQDRVRDLISPLHNLSFIEAKPYKESGYIYEIQPAIHEFARRKASQNELEYLTAAISLIAARIPRSTDDDFVAITQRLEPHVSQCMLYIQQDRTGGQVDLIELEKFANLFRHVGRYNEAFDVYQAILEYLRNDELSDSNFDMMASIENNFGLVHHARREYEKALQAYDRAFYLRERYLAVDKDSLASILCNQGRSLLLLNRLNEALLKLQGAHSHFTEATCDQNKETHERQELSRLNRRILNDIGEAHLRIGELEKAENCIQQAFQGHIDVGHGMHPAAFAVRLNMGRVCVERRLFASARSIFEYIIATYTGWWGRRHLETMRAIDELANSYFKHGKVKRDMGDDGEEQLKRAAELWTETLRFHEETLGKEAEIVALTRLRLHELRWLSSSAPEDLYEIFHKPQSIGQYGPDLTG